MEVPERARLQTEQQESTRTQQHQTLQAHWERTARTTAEMAVGVEPVAAVLMAERQAMEVLETLVVLVVSQDQTTRPAEQKTTVRV